MAASLLRARCRWPPTPGAACRRDDSYSRKGTIPQSPRAILWTENRASPRKFSQSVENVDALGSKAQMPAGLNQAGGTRFATSASAPRSTPPRAVGLPRACRHRRAREPYGFRWPAPPVTSTVMPRARSNRPPLEVQSGPDSECTRLCPVTSRSARQGASMQKSTPPTVRHAFEFHFAN
jgi:hypothetical protein